MNRRDFITWVGLGGVASSLPLAIAACSAPKTTDWQKVGSLEDLDKTGQLQTKSAAGDVLVIGTSKTNNLIAVNPTCTHTGCTVTWQQSAKKFSCPCHGSQFGVDGKVQTGPATRPLTTYAVKIEDNSVLVKS